MKAETIGPRDILPNGTEVAVQNKRGVIVGHEKVADQFGCPIVVHTIHYTKRFSHRGPSGDIYKPIDETSPCNYSFIQPLQ